MRVPGAEPLDEANHRLDPRVSEIVDAIDVDISKLRARVAEETIRATSERELRETITAVVYGRFHAGLSPTRDDVARARRDLQLEQQLRAVVPHESTVCGPIATRPATRALLARTDGPLYLRACIDGVWVLIPKDRVLAEADGTTSVRLPSVRPRLSPGFLVVDGSIGRPAPGDVGRIYVHLADGMRAARVLGQILARLEHEAMVYRAKVASSFTGYPRRDALVLYVPRTFLALGVIVATLLDDDGALGQDTSCFVHVEGRGVGSACDPADERPGWSRMSFGQHWARCVAEGIVDAACLRSDPHAQVIASFLAGGVDPAAPYRSIHGSPETTSPQLAEAPELTARRKAR